MFNVSPFPGARSKQFIKPPTLPADNRKSTAAPTAASNGAIRKQLVALVESTGTALPALLLQYGADNVDRLSDEQCHDAIRLLKAKTAPAPKRSA